MRHLVSNASPLIVLAKADLLRVLPALFPQVLVPEAVVDEIGAGPANDPMRLALASCSWLDFSGFGQRKALGEILEIPPRVESVYAHNPRAGLVDVPRALTQGRAVPVCPGGPTLGLVTESFWIRQEREVRLGGVHGEAPFADKQALGR